MPGLVGLGFYPPLWQPKTLIFCLSVCLSVLLYSGHKIGLNHLVFR